MLFRSLGGCHWAVMEARDELLSRGFQVDYLRVRGFPFGESVRRFLEEHETVFVVEQNRDAQLKTLLVNEARVNASRLLSVLHYDGTPITARFIADHIAKHIAAHTVVPMKKAAS